jgi:GAF domain-containing protein
MPAPPPPPNEAARLAALERYDILDSEREQAYDDFTALAAHICGTPMALIGLIDDRRQWFKSTLNMDGVETPRELTFCAHTLVDNQTLVVPDTFADRRFHDHPSVTGAPKIRFYAGAPIVTADGYSLGTLCVIDDQPRTLSAAQQRALEALSRQVMAHLELRRAMMTLRGTEDAKKKFVAHVSHELRTPLTSIRGALALVLDGDPTLDSDSRELLSAGHRSAASAAANCRWRSGRAICARCWSAPRTRCARSPPTPASRSCLLRPACVSMPISNGSRRW